MRHQQGLLNASNDKQSLQIEDRSESTHNAAQNDNTILNKQYNNNELLTYHVTEDAQEEILVFSTKNKIVLPTICKFDTDLYAIRVDTYASRCISPFIADFVKGSLRELTGGKTVKPFGKGNSLSIAIVGTLKWKF